MTLIEGHARGNERVYNGRDAEVTSEATGRLSAAASLFDLKSHASPTSFLKGRYILR